MTTWQPIETAPKDGTRFLAWLPELEGAPVRVIAWAYTDMDEHYFPWECDDAQSYKYDVPTHWMPLPTPPEPSP